MRSRFQIGKFRIPRRPWDEHDYKANVGQFTKTKTNIGNLPRSRWKTMEIFKKVRFQSFNFTSKPKEYLLQTTKLWEKLIVLNRRKKKATKSKEDVNFVSLKRVKFVEITIVYSIELSDFLVFYFTLVSICKMEFKLLSTSSV